MSGPVFLTVLMAIPVGFTILDLAERRGRCRRLGEKGPPLRTFLFLLVVSLVYAALQSGGFLLLPRTEALVEDGASCFRCLLGRPLTGLPLDTLWSAVLVVVLFYAAGLWDFLMHRFVSHHRWLWFSHEYHHLPRQVCVFMPGIMARPFAVVSTLPVVVATLVTAYVLLTLFGLADNIGTVLQILLIVQLSVLTASHSACLRRWWWVHRLLKWLAVTTPQEHALHHTVDLAGNYGNLTTLWDRLFGTYLDPVRAENQGHGCGLPYDQDFLGTITLGAVKIPPRLRRWLQVGRYCNLHPHAPGDAP
jgi:sterol desaturase/sphingolipid hydroxylase (fatty acid hydroxylase superfamily)